jgi:hypothetical protein
VAFATSDTGKDKYTGYSFEGKPIVVTKRRGFPVKEKRHNQKWWPEKIRTDAATLWAATRNIETVSKLTKVPAPLIREWQSEPWFQNIVSRVVKDHNDVLDQALTSVIHKCVEQIQERLLEGDVKINLRTGDRYQVPVDARALASVMGTIFDKRQLVRGEATSRTETVSADKRLAQLQQEFIKFSQATQIEGEKVNADKEDPVPEKDETDQGQSAPLLIDNETNP